MAKGSIAARLTVLQAARACRPGEVLAARGPGPGGEPFAVLRTSDGRVYVVPDACPHDGGLLSDGFIDGDRLVCARHGWEFDPRTGECPQRRACIESRPIARPLRRPALPFGRPESG